MKCSNVKTGLLLSLCFYSSYGLSEDSVVREQEKSRDFYNSEYFTIQAPEAEGSPSVSGNAEKTKKKST